MGKGGANPPKAAPEAPELNPKQFVVPFLVIARGQRRDVADAALRP